MDLINGLYMTLGFLMGIFIMVFYAYLINGELTKDTNKENK